MWSHLVQDFFHSQRQLNGKVHVGRLLESTSSLETVDTVTRTRNVCHVVVVVEAFPSFHLFGADELQTVITNQDRYRAALSFVCGLGNLQRLDSGHDDVFEVLLVDGQPNGDVRKLAESSLRSDGAESQGIASDLVYRSKDLPLSKAAL